MNLIILWQVKAAGIPILAIGISEWIKRMEILEMASEPDEFNAFFVNSFDDLETIHGSLSTAVCDGM